MKAPTAFSMLVILLSMPQSSFAGQPTSHLGGEDVPHLYEIVCKPDSPYYKGSDLTEIRESILSLINAGSSNSRLEGLDHIAACMLIDSIKAQLMKSGCAAATQDKKSIPAILKKCALVVKSLDLD